MVDIQVLKPNHDLNAREQKILEVLFLNLAAHANAQVTGVNMMFNPLDRLNINMIFNFRFAWQSSITPAQFEELKAGIESRYKNALVMCDILEANIVFAENTYLTSK